MNELRELLQALVAVPSVSGEEDAAADLAASVLAAGGLDVERLNNTVLACLNGGAGPSVLLHSHLDTVPVGEGWSDDPFSAEWSDGRLSGLGANDAKASAAAMMTAFLRLAQNPAPAGTLWLALTAREETDNSGMAAALARIGRPDAAVAGEPTGLEVVRAQMGLVVLTARWTGQSCHAAHVRSTAHQSALLDACAEIAEAAPFLVLDPAHPLLGTSTVVPTVLRAGATHNRVPDRAEALFDARVAPPHDADACVRALSQALPTAAIEVRSDRLQPTETAADHPVVLAALHAAGRRAAIGSNTLSDMALLAGVPAVKCGPGETLRSHRPNEFILESELAAGAAFYERVAPALLDAVAAAPASVPAGARA